ncbi:MAG: class I SAM-dependent methyltransferase [Verrucomicrobia bacterium]|nr:class I SAM-dependent methyltransferase [Verrucomicrobiota bacterium]
MPSPAAQLYQHSFELISIHEALLQDAPRNRAFYQALSQQVKAGSSVLDIGSGTGLWAILAAKLGAARVVAIEKDSLMCGIIRRLAQENGVADRVTVMEGLSSAVDLGGETFDIVLSETVGHLIYDEDIVEVMMDARSRFLKPAGVLIPQSVTLFAAPVNLGEVAQDYPHGLQASFGSFQALALHRPLAYLDKSRFTWLGQKVELAQTDLRTCTGRPDLTQLSATWTLADTTALDGVAVWAEMQLSDDLTLSTLDTPSWSVTVYRLAPFTAAAGQLDYKLEILPETNAWTGTLGGQSQRLSPAIAATQMVMQSRVALEHLPHLLQSSSFPVQPSSFSLHPSTGSAA